jgi:hypothetical protein
MIVSVKVKTGAHNDSIDYDVVSHTYVVTVRARPIEGEANKAIIQLLATKLKIPKTRITLKSGLKSRTKLFEY